MRRRKLLLICMLLISCSGCERLIRDGLRDGVSNSISDAATGFLSLFMPFVG